MQENDAMIEVADESLYTRRKRYASAVTDPALVGRAAVDAFRKLDPAPCWSAIR